MAERYPEDDSTKGGSVLPSTEPKPATQPADLLSKFLPAKAEQLAFFNHSLVTTMAVTMAFAGPETTAISSRPSTTC